MLHMRECTTAVYPQIKRAARAFLDMMLLIGKPVAQLCIFFAMQVQRAIGAPYMLPSPKTMPPIPSGSSDQSDRGNGKADSSAWRAQFFVV